MILDDIRKAVGRKCSLLDSSGLFVDGLVLEADLTNMANERWRYLHLKYANKYPEALTVESTIDLVEDQHTYDLSAITTGAGEMDLRYVGIMFDTTDTYYKRVMPRDYKLLFKADTNLSLFEQTNPYYFILPTDPAVAGDKITGRSIRIIPTPDTAVTGGLLLKLVETPVAMSGNTDTPYTLPSMMHELIVDYMVADVWQIKRDWTNSNEAMGRAVYNEKRFFDEYQPSSADLPVKIDIGKRFRPKIR